jgi:hypothetical protein
MTKIRMRQTVERRVADSKGNGIVKKLIEGSVVTVDDASATRLIALGYAEAA